jgi:hypothetical protein
MIKLSVSDNNSKTIILYCSVVPHDYPPYHRLDFAKKLSKSINVIFIDTPTLFKKVTIHELIYFYLSLLGNLINFKFNFIWEFIGFRKINFLSLKYFIIIQKYIFGKQVILYCTSGYWDSVFDYINADKSIFDCPDVHENEFNNNRKWIGEFDVVLVNSLPVYDYVKKFNNNLKIVGTGYFNNLNKVLFKNKLTDSVVFFGGISQRIDYELLLHIVKKLPKIEFYFIGDIYLNKYYQEKGDNVNFKKWENLTRFSNVHYLGVLRDINSISAILPFFKVGIIPYISEDIFNYYSNPIKLYEYLAYGMGVVSTALANISVLKEIYPVRIALTTGEFARNINTMLRKKISKKKYNYLINNLIKKQDMDLKVKQVLGIIKKMKPL